MLMLKREVDRERYRNLAFGIAWGSWMSMLVYLLLLLLGVCELPKDMGKVMEAFGFAWMFFSGIIIVDRIIELHDRQDGLNGDSYDI